MPAARALLPLLALLVGAVPGRGAEAWRARDHLRPGQVVIQGHRGVGHLAEENTVEAFELGWRLGVIPEAELRAWRALVPEGDTLLWMHGNEAELRRDLAALRAERFAGITQLQVHVYPKETTDRWAPPADPSPPDNPFRLRNAFLREVGNELRAHGILYQAFPYTPAADVYGQLLDLGVMSFATDHPDVAVREVNAYLARP